MRSQCTEHFAQQRRYRHQRGLYFGNLKLINSFPFVNINFIFRRLFTLSSEDRERGDQPAAERLKFSRRRGLGCRNDLGVQWATGSGIVLQDLHEVHLLSQ